MSFYAEARHLLERTFERIHAPEHWTRYAVARDDLGTSCPATSSHARRWCLAGALMREDQVWIEQQRARTAHIATDAPIVLDHAGDPYNLAAHYIRRAAQSRGYVQWPAANDEGGHTVVLAILRDAIDLLDKDIENRVPPPFPPAGSI